MILHYYFVRVNLFTAAIVIVTCALEANELRTLGVTELPVHYAGTTSDQDGTEDMECLFRNDEAEIYKEKRMVQIIAVRRETAYVESGNRKAAEYISTERDVWQGHANIRIMEEMENEQVVIMKTTVGDIELELWAKETPKACKNFI
ncbi:Peptidyl-prolyl cis-trans isomerase CWC27 like protein [Eufriesea mexicana]|nr:Peptidyl-prolyl cis-trans isomerase CWC27 like protein [Eufriesea mexicana]